MFRSFVWTLCPRTGEAGSAEYRSAEYRSQSKDRQNRVPTPATPEPIIPACTAFCATASSYKSPSKTTDDVTGFVSRFGDSESDRGVFLDHFFKTPSSIASQLTFTTDTVHGISFRIRGTVERGEGKSRGDEAYYVLKGTLVENTIDEAKKSSSRSREVALKKLSARYGAASGAEGVAVSHGRVHDRASVSSAVQGFCCVPS